MPGADRVLWRDAESGQPALTEAMVRFAVREEMALTVEDVLARRCRALFLDAAAAEALAEPVAAVMAVECAKAGRAFDAAASVEGLVALARRYRALP